VGALVSEATSIKLELDVDRLGEQIAKQVAEHLARLFPQDAAEFWAALCDQAYRERQRVAALLDITCPHKDRCPHKPDILAGIRLEGEPRDRSGDGDDSPELLDSDPGHEPDRAVGREREGRRTAAR
jgi:hypothetical protein